MLFVRKCNIFEEESTPKPNHQWGVSRSYENMKELIRICQKKL